MRKLIACLLLTGCTIFEDVGTRGGDPPEPSPLGATIWSQTFGGPGDDQIQTLVVDVAGDLVIAGALSAAPDTSSVPPISLGGDPLSSPGVSAGFIAKYTMAGEHVWSRGFSGSGQPWITRIAATADGGILAAGIVCGEVNFGDRVVIADEYCDAVLVRLDADGEVLWLRHHGAPGRREGIEDVAVDAAGDIYIAGWFNESLELPVGTLIDAGGGDAFVARLNAAGEYQWAVRYGGDAQDTAIHVDVTPDGSIYTGGAVAGAVDFGADRAPFLTSPLYGYGFSDASLLKLAGDGSLVWAHRIGGENHEGAYGQGVAGGDAFLVVSFQSQDPLRVDDGTVLDSSWGHGLAVLRFSDAGVLQWIVDVEATQSGVCGFTATDDGRILLTTESIQDADSPHSPLVAVMSPDTGEIVSRSIYSGPLGTRGHAIASDGADGVVFAGRFENINGTLLDLGAGTHASAGREDMFVARVVPVTGGDE